MRAFRGLAVACALTGAVLLGALPSAAPALPGTFDHKARSAHRPKRHPARGLVAAGTRLCRSVHLGVSVTERSCEALQRTIRGKPYPFVWQMSEVMSATLTAGAKAPASLRRHYATELYSTFSHYAGRHFSRGLPPIAGDTYGVRFYDDNVWVALDLIRAYRQSHDRRLLRAAEAVLKFERTGQWRPSDPPDQQRYPGGIYWNTSRDIRAVNSTAGSAEVALELYLINHTRADLAFAEREYSWTQQTLSTPDHLYRGHVAAGGTIVGAPGDNGAAMMIGDGVLLYRITHHKQYLTEARQTAHAGLKRFTPRSVEGTCPAYDASFFSNLLMLKGLANLAPVHRLLDAYATWVARHSNPRTGVFEGSFAKPCAAPAPQAGATEALLLKAIG